MPREAKAPGEKFTHVQFYAEPRDMDELRRLVAAMKCSQGEILRTGLKIMLERAYGMGLISRPAEAEAEVQHDAPAELVTPALRAV